jgi:ABC-type uncharacterized transport system substrate-binding protein
MNLFFWVLCASLAAIFGTAAAGRAHPHVWVDYAVEARFDENGLTGFQQRWIFDEMFSSQIMEMFDADMDGVFSPAEIEEVRQGAFDYLREYNYFIQIKIDGEDFAVQYVHDFHARIDGHRIIYEFFVPCTVTAAATPKTIHLLVADMEYFVDMSFVAGELTIQGKEYVDVAHEFASGEAFSFWGGSWSPKHFTLRFQKTP